MGDFMYKRIIIFFSLIMSCICFIAFNLFSISKGDNLYSAAVQQSLYTLKVADFRGNIYDCRNIPLVGNEKETIIAINPSLETASALSKVLSSEELKDVMEMSKGGKPFTYKLGSTRNIVGSNIFKINSRYSKNKNIAQHILGYLDSSFNGVCGIEKAFNEYLNEDKGEISIKYKVDALNRMIPGESVKIENTFYKQTKGVVLTLDKRLQEIAEIAAERYIKKGAILVAEVPTCKIRACVSMPDFSPSNIAKVLEDKDSPLINRAFYAYNLGSVFKLVTAVAALESGISGDEIFNCTGTVKVEDAGFHCFNGKAHKDINMEQALAYSCNCYFVEMAKRVGAETMLKFSHLLGFGRSIELAPGMVSQKGNLPTLEQLSNIKTLSNFSFGQGSLLATPIQTLGLINAIASGGYYVKPQLVEGLVNESLEYVNKVAPIGKIRVFSSNSAEILKKGMVASVEYGTGTQAKPLNGQAAAKTGTAQTGMKVNDRSVIQCWLAGFYPAEKPKYSILVFAEDADGGGQSCGPAFKKIANDIYNKLPELLLE